jgi:predicted TPR repeat methyltransferase
MNPALTPSEKTLSFPQRPCPVCMALEPKPLFRQSFASYSDHGLMPGYDVTVCINCGGGYADHIPPQSVFDQYYRDMSKYAQPQNAGHIGATDAERFRQVVDLISPHLQPNQRIADIGCATGALLAEFQRRGFHDLTGFDPSPECTDIARRLYGIQTRQAFIKDLGTVTERFDLVVLTCVLEHLADVDTSLHLLSDLLKPSGQIYFEVPDASRYDHWFSPPFQFFSMEHVNYFAPQSLRSLLARHGFECIFVERVKRFMSPTAVEPAVAGLFRLAPKPASVLPDDETEPALQRYIAQSRQLESSIHETIARLVERQVPLVVWGTGTHTLRLLETSPLPQAHLVAFLDSNPGYQGQQLRGVPILAPDQFDRTDATILISSHAAEREIKHQIQNVRHWPNEIVCLYENAPVELG